MPRQARLDAPGALHHIIVRRIDKTNIFRDNQDRTLFLDRLGELVVKGKCLVYAWVLMDNHVHLLFQTGEAGISSVMRKLLIWYAQYFNNRHKRVGHLFQNRYKSILCEHETYLIALIRYIHLNPVRAGIVKTIEELDRYGWSGHATIIGKAKRPWMDRDAVLSQFSATKRKASAEYRRFIQSEFSARRKSELTGGGWSQVLAHRRRGLKEEFDERILGSGDFVHQVLLKTEERVLRQTKLRRQGKRSAMSSKNSAKRGESVSLS